MHPATLPVAPWSRMGACRAILIGPDGRPRRRDRRPAVPRRPRRPARERKTTAASSPRRTARPRPRSAPCSPGAPGGRDPGEEGGEPARRAPLDHRPIDGTAQFVAGDDRGCPGRPEEAGEIVAGVAAVPAQGRLWWARRGGGAYREPRRYGGPAIPRHRPALGAGGQQARRHPGGPEPLPQRPGHRRAAERGATAQVEWDVHAALLVANGSLDVALQTRGELWDFAATALIVPRPAAATAGRTGSGGRERARRCLPAAGRCGRRPAAPCGDRLPGYGGKAVPWLRTAAFLDGNRLTVRMAWRTFVHDLATADVRLDVRKSVYQQTVQARCAVWPTRTTRTGRSSRPCRVVTVSVAVASA